METGVVAPPAAPTVVEHVPLAVTLTIVFGPTVTGVHVSAGMLMAFPDTVAQLESEYDWTFALQTPLVTLHVQPVQVRASVTDFAMRVRWGAVCGQLTSPFATKQVFVPCGGWHRLAHVVDEDGVQSAA